MTTTENTGDAKWFSVVFDRREAGQTGLPNYWCDADDDRQDAKLAEVLRAERQYAREHNILRTEHMNDDRSPRAHDGRVAATARARESFMTAFGALSDEELAAYPDYRKSH